VPELSARSAGFFRAAVSLLALLLIGFAGPASVAPGLASNDNDLCLLTAIPVFFLAALVAALPLKRVGAPLALGAFLGCWLIQAWALSWIEGYPLLKAFTSRANGALHVWGTLYLASPAVLLAFFIFLGRRRPAGHHGCV
jgi:hypothetical protein